MEFGKRTDGKAGNSLFFIDDATKTVYEARLIITNTAPTAQNDSAEVDEDSDANAVNVLSNDSDPDAGNTLTITGVTQGANGAVAITGGGTGLTYKPNANYNGSDSFTYTIDDGNGGTATATVSVTVKSINDAPVLAAIGNKMVDEETALTFTASAADSSDNPSNNLSYSLVNAPNGAAINGTTGAFSWTPTEVQGTGGTFTFTVKVTDDGNPALSDEEEITVTVNEINVAPQFSTVPTSATIDELSAYTFTAAATDADIPAQTLTFSLIGAPAGASITAGGAFSWTPTEAQGNGSTYSFTVRVSDGAANADAPISLTVSEVNSAPTLAAIADQAVDELTQLSVTAAGADTDDPANTLTYSLDAGFPSGMTIDGDSGAISWTPTELQGAGSYPVTVRVTDNGTGSLSATRTFNVQVKEVNVAPVLAPVGGSTIDEQAAFSFNAAATDADLNTDNTPANNLSFSLTGNVPIGAAITSGGAFSWTPDESQGPGSYTFTVKVTDNGSPALSDEEQITITVNEVNRPPVLAAINNQTGVWGNAFAFTASATDPDIPNNALTFSLTGAVPAGAAITAGGAFSWTPAMTQIGIFTFNVRVTDNGSPSKFDEKSVTITVGKRATALAYTGDGSEQYSDKQALSATLTDIGGGSLNNNALPGKMVGFVIGTQNASSLTDNFGAASTDLILTQNPNQNYTVNSSFAGDAYYLPSSDSDQFDIVQEDARVYYTGMTFVNTSCATCGTAATTLSATIKDITTETADAAYDNLEGDISKATVTFVNRDASNAPITGCVNLSVQPVSSADPKVGTVTCNWTANIGNASSDSFNIGIVVGNYYLRNAGTENAVVTVSKPLGTNFITGGGYLLLGGSSAGQYAGAAGLKTNFGFNVKYNNNGTNLQGKVNIIVRAANGKVYQIKANSMDTLSVNNSNPNSRTAVFTSKASLTDITNPLVPVPLDGGHSFQMRLTDKGEPGSNDTIGVTLYAKGTGALLFSSNWDGTRTVEQILGGGNLQVR